MSLAAGLQAHVDRPLPALPEQTSDDVQVDSELRSKVPPVGDSLPNYRDLLRKTLSGLKDLDLTGQITHDRDCDYLAGGAYGDIRTGKYQVAERCVVKVAVKTLRVYLHENNDIIKQIEREIRIWSRLKHPNILPLVGYMVDDHGLPALVSEFMENRTVLKYIQAHPECDIIQMTLGIAEGISYLHNAKVIHSDIKSDNVLVSPSGDPLICDFGISRLITVSHTMGEQNILAHSSTIRGSARWMAPDLLMPKSGRAMHSEQSDIWAFGMTIYELLTRKRPYYHLVCDPQVITSIIYGELPRRPKSSQSWWDKYGDLWSICEACWSADPSRRPSAAQITSILKALNTYMVQGDLESNPNHDVFLPNLIQQPKSPKRMETYESFEDMGISVRKLEGKDNKCNIM